MTQIIVTAVLKSKEGYEEQLLAELKKVQKGSTEEAGCIQYTIHQSIEDQTFVLYEIWKDLQAVEIHNETVHYQEYRKNTADLVAAKTIYRLKEL